MANEQPFGNETKLKHLRHRYQIHQQIKLLLSIQIWYLLSDPGFMLEYEYG